MSDILVCKNCRAPLSSTATFCRNCNTPFPETMEVEEDFDLPALPPHLRPDQPTSPETETPPTQEVRPGHEQDTSLEQTTQPEDAPPEEDPQPAPEIPETPPKTQPEPRKPPPPASGELAVFENPDLATSGANLPPPGSRKQSVSSANVIAAVAAESGSSREEVAKVVDGFWDYVADVKGHYGNRSRLSFLVIPHFGTFRFQYKKGKKGLRSKLTFRSSTTRSAKRHGGLHSSSWVDQWSGKPEGLSVRRRISVYVVARSGLPLRKTDEILNRLLRAVRELCENGNTIHWARRGTMGAFRIVDVKERDGINPQTGERIKIQSGRNAITGEKAKGTEEDHFCFGASKGFLQRLNAPEPDPARFSSQTTSRRRREKSARAGAANTEKTKKFCCGCLIGIVIFIILSIWLIQNENSEPEAAWETGSKTTAHGDDALYELKGRQLIDDKPPKSDTPPGQDHKTKIYFQSLIDQPVLIYWVNFEGEPEPWGRLNPKEGRRLDTYAGHVWLITDLNKKPLTYFVAERRSGYAAIRPGQSDSTSAEERH